MRWSKYFIPTIKETPVGTEAISHQLLLRSGMVNMLTSGVYSYLPLGLRVLSKIENIIREEMNDTGAHELFLPCLQPLELWKKTGRDETLKDVMIKFQDGKGRTVCLGPTHEEIITQLAKEYVHSYKQLPVTLYQIQTKFRDELRARFGIVRACEFIMKDAYSFDKDKEGLVKNYELMYEAYKKIFSRCDLDVVIVEADSGAMGGDISHEYMVPAPIGEDSVSVCPSCGYSCGEKQNAKEGSACLECKKGELEKKAAIELGHIFQLGTKYTVPLGAVFLDENGKQQPMIMGCYGIGVSRMIAAVIETHHDEGGIIWPQEIAPFDIEILPLQIDNDQIMECANGYYKQLSDLGMDVLIDDRKESVGRKFNDADLIGIPWRIVMGKKTFAEGSVEIKSRATGETIKVPVDKVINKVKEMILQ